MASMGFSTYLEQAVMGMLFGRYATYTPPATYYVALFDPTLTELAIDTYARVPLANNSTNFSTSSGGGPTTVTVQTTVSFATAANPWTTAAYVALYDAATAGNQCLAPQLMTPAISCPVGQNIAFPPSSLVLTLN